MADGGPHYFAVHLHPFAESLELRDWTSGETGGGTGTVAINDVSPLLGLYDVKMTLGNSTNVSNYISISIYIYIRIISAICV